jgi:hypothetical protein
VVLRFVKPRCTALLDHTYQPSCVPSRPSGPRACN